jgi:hypothetical protein
VIELGREICFNDEHSEKQPLPSEVIELGREICVNDEHNEKQYSPSEVIELGREIQIKLSNSYSKTYSKESKGILQSIMYFVVNLLIIDFS